MKPPRLEIDPEAWAELRETGRMVRDALLGSSALVFGLVGLSMASGDPTARAAQLAAIHCKDDAMSYYDGADAPTDHDSAPAPVHPEEATPCGVLCESAASDEPCTQEARAHWVVSGDPARGWLAFVTQQQPADSQLPLLIAEACGLSGVCPELLTALLWQESRLRHWRSPGVVIKGDGGRSHGIGQIQRATWERYFSYRRDWFGGERKVRCADLRDNILMACGVLCYSGYSPDLGEAELRVVLRKYNGGGRGWTSAQANAYASSVLRWREMISGFEPQLDAGQAQGPAATNTDLESSGGGGSGIPAAAAPGGIEDDSLDLPGAASIDDDPEWPLDPVFDDALPVSDGPHAEE